MAAFELTTNGIEVGYSSNGFFAFGTSTIHKFDSNDWNHAPPQMRGMPVSWAIDLRCEDPFEKYVKYTYPASELSPRVPLLQSYFSEIGQRPVGQLHRWDQNEPISLTYSFPSDPALAAFIMGIITADREMVIWSQGWIFLADDDKLAPAVTKDGFMERKEPAFTTDMPVLRLR